jgi:TrmH family RNA methyltransferase
MNTPLSARNPRVARARQLVRDRRRRRAEGRYVVEGPRLIAEALAAGVELEVALVEARAVPGLAASLDAAGVAWDVVADGVLDRVGDARTSQGAIAVATAPALDRPLPPGADLVLVLVGVADPGNVGTLLRAAGAAGAAAVLAGPGADVLSPKVVRASAGAVFRAPVAEVADPAAALAGLVGRGLVLVGAATRGGTPPEDAPLGGPVALVLGSEAHGLPAHLDEALHSRVTVPMPGGAESLNVAMAGTVLLFEALRQRRAANRLDAEHLAGQG